MPTPTRDVCACCGQPITEPQIELLDPDDLTNRRVAGATIEQAMGLLLAWRPLPTRAGDPPASKRASIDWSAAAGPRRVKAYGYLLERGGTGAILEEIATELDCAENSISTQLSTMRDKLHLLSYGPDLRYSSRQTHQGVWRTL